MYVVFTENVIHYLGDDRHYASEVWCEQKRATLVPITSLEDLRQILTEPQAFRPKEQEESFYPDEAFDDYRQAVEEPAMSEAAAKLFEKLDELGLSAENTDNWAREFKEKGDKVVAEVKSLGVRGMRAVGEGFKALGDLLKREADDDEDEQFIQDLKDLDDDRDEDGWRQSPGLRL
jgi:hypothetical protein